ncbi:ImmA/IrrE family metallo-endopeptidase [Ensifer adhaerens]|uniref:ImmA/IrrE family metallo-endopeptidase n=1 Tax=Ensifer adhaerens TaxID=106592 RepID=UPI0039C8D523
MHDGIPHEIVLAEELSKRERRLVLAHETGHALYDTAETGQGGRDIDALLGLSCWRSIE